MHRGVQELVQWLEKNRDAEGVKLQAPARASDVQALEHDLGSPIPTDLRLVLGRFNGAALPTGAVLLTAAPGPGPTIEAATKEVAGQRGGEFLDQDQLLPFARTEHGTVLAFDRSAAPVADTWPIVDFDPETAETRIVHRTFDGWCRLQVSEWTAPDREDEFTLDKYLRTGQRHADVEKDVSIAHVTVGHALRRAGRPEDALASYQRGARCVPAIPWADWEALKLAAILRRWTDALEAGARLAKRTRSSVWALRGTTPSRVAFLLGRAMRASGTIELTPWLRAVDHLVSQPQDDDDAAAVKAIRAALDEARTPIPAPSPAQSNVVPVGEDLDATFDAMKAAYAAGQLRDDDLALDPSYDPIAARHDLADVLRIRREF